jgi:hypothetical protein
VTTIRLAYAAYNHGRVRQAALGERMTTVRLVEVPGTPSSNALRGARGAAKTEGVPALLVSFVYLEQFLRYRNDYVMRDWVLDSGAFSAHASGTPVDLEHYIATAKHLLATDPKLTEVFALDVIGDHEASRRNTERMWEAGVQAIPCFHYGEPIEALKHMAAHYPKIALGGVARMRDKRKVEWARACFAHVWPKKIHGFGICSDAALSTLPFHSVDATSWEFGPCRFGQWKTYGKASVRGSNQDLRSEIEWYLRMERKYQQLWAKEMALLDGLSVKGGGDADGGTPQRRARQRRSAG